MKTYTGNVVVTGAVSAGNMHSTMVTITPTAKTPTSVEITGVGLRGRGPVRGQVTPHSSVPGTRTVEATLTAISPDGCRVWLYRTNRVETNLSVLLWRDQ